VVPSTDENISKTDTTYIAMSGIVPVPAVLHMIGVKEHHFCPIEIVQLKTVIGHQKKLSKLDVIVNNHTTRVGMQVRNCLGHLQGVFYFFRGSEVILWLQLDRIVQVELFPTLICRYGSHFNVSDRHVFAEHGEATKAVHVDEHGVGRKDLSNNHFHTHELVVFQGEAFFSVIVFGYFESDCFSRNVRFKHVTI
jgi:hypothetical protein